MRIADAVSNGAAFATARLRASVSAHGKSVSCVRVARKRHRLTPREIEILSAYGNGHTTESTAALLQIGRRTVEDHVRHACAKLGAKNRTHAVALAVQAGLITLARDSSDGANRDEPNPDEPNSEP